MLRGCAAKQTAPANTEALVFDHAYPLDYARQFTADCYEGGSTLLTLTGSGEQFLVLPEDAAEVDGLPAGVTALRQPVQISISSPLGDGPVPPSGRAGLHHPLRHPGRRLASRRGQSRHGGGRIAYAGKYSAPDYEQILASNCGLAIENTMILHTRRSRSSWNGSASRWW